MQLWNDIIIHVCPDYMNILCFLYLCIYNSSQKYVSAHFLSYSPFLLPFLLIFLSSYPIVFLSPFVLSSCFFLFFSSFLLFSWFPSLSFLIAFFLGLLNPCLLFSISSCLFVSMYRCLHVSLSLCLLVFLSPFLVVLLSRCPLVFL